MHEPFRGLIPPLTAAEFELLERSILDEGCRDALVLWNDKLLDGHNRQQIWEKHGLPYKTTTLLRLKSHSELKADYGRYRSAEIMGGRNICS